MHLVTRSGENIDDGIGIFGADQLSSGGAILPFHLILFSLDEISGFHGEIPGPDPAFRVAQLLERIAQGVLAHLQIPLMSK